MELCQDEFMDIGKRLVQERKRLGLSQTAFAKQIGVSISSQKRYESGDREPDTGYLKRAISLGVNIPYVVTGETIMEFPGKVGYLASLVFQKSNSGQFPEAMEALFYILGANMINEGTIRGMKDYLQITLIC